MQRDGQLAAMHMPRTSGTDVTDAISLLTVQGDGQLAAMHVPRISGTDVTDVISLLAVQGDGQLAVMHVPRTSGYTGTKFTVSGTGTDVETSGGLS